MFDPLKNQSFKESESLKEKAPEVKKEKKFRAFRKDVKRIIWPSGKESWKWFAYTLIFVIIFAIFFFIITFAFTSIWNSVGIKL
ncbi:preprotein translocase subunit SecE [[Mycoplasma] gypis]|uniref:Preprotein translocase subunit SecE n=1 Tax=[Mycoplasma] gypis TaxID=92404 RepID=A0ABZ2RME6_9BACT|nr:preprotein translocase subunit SecE [[Mycoplasma] gypis]MBN0919083.1 preprotein translocase subunit SecE [[Mycoplasma] gypis]